MSQPYTDDDVARLRSFRALRGGEQPDPNEVAYLSRPLRWLATLDASRAAYAALVTERDEAVRLLRKVKDHGTHAGCGPRCDINERIERFLSLAPAPGAVDDGGDSVQHVMETTCPRCARSWKEHSGDEVEAACPLRAAQREVSP